MADAPDEVRAIRAYDEFENGPVPVFVRWKGDEAEVTLDYAMGEIGSVASVRVGARYSNHEDWDRSDQGNPWDDLSDAVVAMIEISLADAQTSIPGMIGSGQQRQL
jgi:hypothetical protein